MGFKNSPARRTQPARLDEANLLDYALKSLSHRAHSEKELRTRLNRRSASQAATDAVVAKLREYGYLDDSRFAESFATSRLEGRGHGPQRVLRDLRARSVSATNAEAAVDRVFAGADEAALAAQYLTRKFRGKNLLEFLADRLGRFKMPRHVEITEEPLPKTGTGKVRKMVIKERFWAGRARRVQGG